MNSLVYWMISAPLWQLFLVMAMFGMLAYLLVKDVRREYAESHAKLRSLREASEEADRQDVLQSTVSEEVLQGLSKTGI